MRLRLFFIILLSIAPLFSYAGSRINMRGERYCEILFSKTLRTYAVYNTIGLNTCPENLWRKITVADIKKQTNAIFVHLNGPRFWVIDGLENSDLVNPTIKTFNGIAMREAGILDIGLFELFKKKPYKTHKVKRQTTWIYEAGKPVYELIDPHNNVFVMQSYSIQKYPQTEASLSQLGTKLHLPAGWVFKTGVIKTLSTVKAINNLAVVIQDDFFNTYQKATHDLLD